MTQSEAAKVTDVSVLDTSQEDVYASLFLNVCKYTKSKEKCKQHTRERGINLNMNIGTLTQLTARLHNVLKTWLSYIT